MSGIAVELQLFEHSLAISVVATGECVYD